MCVVKAPRGVQVDFGHPLSRGLSCAFLMNEGHGGTVFDASVRGGHGSMGSGVSWATQAGAGRVVDFDGTAEAVILVPHIDISGEGTVIARVRYDDVGSDRGIASRTGPGAQEWLMWMDVATPPRFAAAVHDGGFNTQYGTSTVSAGVWYTVGMTYGQSSLHLFVDGVEEGSGKGATMTAYPGNDWRIGQHYPGLKYNDGQMAYFFAWRRRLSAGEMAAQFRDPFAMFLRPGQLQAPGRRRVAARRRRMERY